MCLKRLKLPDAIVEKLLDTLPREMTPVIMWVLKKPDPWTINIGSFLQNKIIKDYKLHKEIISLHGKENSRKKNCFSIYYLCWIFVSDEDSSESFDELYSSENDNDEFLNRSNYDIEYTPTKKTYSKKKLKLENKANNSKISKRKRTKKLEVCRDVQSTDIKKIKLKPTNVALSDPIESKGMFNCLIIKMLLNRY